MLRLITRAARPRALPVLSRARRLFSGGPGDTNNMDGVDPAVTPADSKADELGLNRFHRADFTPEMTMFVRMSQDSEPSFTCPHCSNLCTVLCECFLHVVVSQRGLLTIRYTLSTLNDHRGSHEYIPMRGVRQDIRAAEGEPGDTTADPDTGRTLLDSKAADLDPRKEDDDAPYTAAGQ